MYLWFTVDDLGNCENSMELDVLAKNDERWWRIEDIETIEMLSECLAINPVQSIRLD